MIKTFKSRSLRKFFEDGETKGIEQSLTSRVKRRLDALNAATVATDMDIPGYDLHSLKGKRSGTWSVKVSGNWRVTFTFKGGDAYDVDLVDYH